MDGFYSDLTNIYMSIPEIRLPNEKLTNDEIINRVKAQFKGTEKEFVKLSGAIKKSFRMCGTEIRYYADEELGGDIGKHAAEVSMDLLKRNEVEPDEIGMIIYGGISRTYLEPAIATEVAYHMGIKRVQAFDVTCACSALLQAVYVGATYLKANENLNYVLCCSGEFPDEVIDYDIQSIEELHMKFGALTLGAAASAVLLSKKPFKNSCLKIHSMRGISEVKNWDSCRTPIRGGVKANSLVIFDDARTCLPDEIFGHLGLLKWKVEDLKQIIFHQSSDYINNWFIDNMPGFTKENMILTHKYYGNTASTSIFLAFAHYIKENKMNHDDKIFFIAPGGGFTMLTAGVSWVEV